MESYFFAARSEFGLVVERMRNAARCDSLPVGVPALVITKASVITP